MKILIWIDKQSFLYKESLQASLICVYVYVKELRHLDYCGSPPFSSLGEKSHINLLNKRLDCLPQRKLHPFFLFPPPRLDTIAQRMARFLQTNRGTIIIALQSSAWNMTLKRNLGQSKTY